MRRWIWIVLLLVASRANTPFFHNANRTRHEAINLFNRIKLSEF